MPKLYDEDQKKVDDFIKSNVNDVERQPFKLTRLLMIIFLVLGLLTGVSYLVAMSHGYV